MRWLLCLVLCALAGVAAGQGATVHGRVVDEAGAPVVGATVQLGDQTAVTDDAGAFTLTGTGTLTVTADGYSTVAVNAKQGVVVRLPRSSGELIEVTGKAPEESKPLE